MKSVYKCEEVLKRIEIELAKKGTEETVLGAGISRLAGKPCPILCPAYLRYPMH